jgi:hypothetical protein
VLIIVQTFREGLARKPPAPAPSRATHGVGRLPLQTASQQEARHPAARDKKCQSNGTGQGRLAQFLSSLFASGSLQVLNQMMQLLNQF